VIATALAVEVLACQPQSRRSESLFRALSTGAAALGLEMRQTQRYTGDAPWLMLWGPGAPDRFAPMRKQVERGGHVLAWDLSYFDRQVKARVSIDAPHPQAWVMRKDWPRDRFDREGIQVADRWNPKGPIIVAGIGPKATTQYGDTVVQGWERAQIARCQARWTRPIGYRMKKPGASIPAGTSICSMNPIDTIISGASLVITWHSNVAIDAIRLGIPVVCRDGAAAAVCPSEVSDVHQPLDPALRARFLANLAWFQWAPTEAVAFWQWAMELLQ